MSPVPHRPELAPGPRWAMLALVGIAQPAMAVDNPDACRALAEHVLTQTQQQLVALNTPTVVQLATNELATRTAFLNWSVAPARADLALNGDQVEVTTCWFPTTTGKLCMLGFVRETTTIRQTQAQSTLSMEPLGQGGCQ